MELASFHLFILVVSICLLKATAELDCTIDEAKGFEDPDNVYTCNGKDEKCCIEATKPSCCADKDISVEVLEQVKLWGGLIGSLVLVGIIVLCYRREKSCCGSNDEQGGCCCCSGKKKQNDDVLHLTDDMSPADDIKKIPLA